MVHLPGGGDAERLSVAGGRVLEAPGRVFAVDGSWRLCPCPEVLPAATTRRGESSGMN